MAAGDTMSIKGAAPEPIEAASGPAAPTEWHAMPEQAGALFEHGCATGVGDEAKQPEHAWSNDAMADLSQFGLISVEGPDAAKFLASLFTGDVRLISASQAQFTGWCDAKGRMLTTFWLLMRGEVYYLFLPMELLPSTMTRLQQFRLRSKVTIADASSGLVRLGLSGRGLQARLAETLGEEPPLSRGESRAFDDCTLISIGITPCPRWLVIGPAEPVRALWDTLRPGTQTVGGGVWALLDILAGIPLLVPETSGEFVPQMLNLEALGGLCFTKGCYPGQEVVARLHYRGQLKRRLYLATLDSDRVPAPGAKLYAEGTSESVGMVVSAAFIQPGKVALLAVVVIEHREQGDIHLADLQGPCLEFRPDPAVAVNESDPDHRSSRT